MLGRDLAKAWNSPGVTIRAREKVIRLIIKEIIVVPADDKLELIIHWQGGDHTRDDERRRTRSDKPVGWLRPMLSISCGCWRDNCQTWQSPPS